MAYVATKLRKVIEIESIITIHYFEYMRDFVFSGESHDFWEFLYVDKGAVDVYAGDKWLTVKQGEIIFHKPNEFHALKSVGKASPNLVVASFKSKSELIKLFEGKKYAINKDEKVVLSSYINQAKTILKTPLNIPSVEQVLLKPDLKIGEEQILQSILEYFLILNLQNHIEAGEAEVNNTKDKEEEIELSSLSTEDSISKKSLNYFNMSVGMKGMDKEKLLVEVIRYMEFHICDRLSIGEICSKFGMSKSYLHNLFYKAKGCGAIDYFNKLKLGRAKTIIREGNMSFTEISIFLSYGSLSYFSKAFRKLENMSPMEYAASVKNISNLTRERF